MTHSPHNLTADQIGTAQGWRLLDADEIVSGAPDLQQIEAWVAERGRWSSKLRFAGNEPSITFRTQLTRKQLAVIRNLSK